MALRIAFLSIFFLANCNISVVYAVDNRTNTIKQEMSVPKASREEIVDPNIRNVELTSVAGLVPLFSLPFGDGSVSYSGQEFIQLNKPRMYSVLLRFDDHSGRSIFTLVINEEQARDFGEFLTLLTKQDGKETKSRDWIVNYKAFGANFAVVGHPNEVLILASESLGNSSRIVAQPKDVVVIKEMFQQVLDRVQKIK